MHIEIGGISAKCLVCGSNDFESLRPRPDEPSDKLACTGCCTEVFYDDLLQIGQTAIVSGKASHIPRQWMLGLP
jgi:hypothetical protein